MTNQELKAHKEQINSCIKIIENKFNTTYWYYDNWLKVYRFKVLNCEESLNLSKKTMIALSQNLIG